MPLLRDAGGERMIKDSYDNRGRAEPPEGGRVLLVDDDPKACRVLEMALEQDYQVTWRTSAEEGFDVLSETAFDVVLTDVNMGTLGGIEFCERVLGVRPDIPVIVVTGYGSLETAIGAIRAGAYDFLTKPLDLNLARATVARAIRHRRIQEELRCLRGKSVEPELLGIVGSSAIMRRIFDLISRISSSDASILIVGESGTGKELVARAIHRLSTRRAAPFLSVNCAAMPKDLLEAELFGHVRRAVEDAAADQLGLLVGAKDGTVFLDDIGELPPELQPKLLRSLRERKVRPVGGKADVPFDARIIAATKRDLQVAVFENRFRDDLYYSINVLTINVPPLRQRGPDILQLAHYFMESAAKRSRKEVRGIDAAAAEKLVAYDWPGNVRELENCIEGVVALMRFDRVTVDDLPEYIQNYHADGFVVTTDDPSELVTAAEMERRYIMRVLALVRGNKSQAAKILGYNRRTLYRKMAERDRHGEEEFVAKGDDE